MINKYENYKISGYEWLGEIPQNWNISRIARYYKTRNEKVDDTTFPPLSVTMSGIVDQLENVSKSDDGDNRKLVRKNDFVINSRSDRKGSSGISPRDGSVSLINIVLEPIKPNEVYPKFSQYLFKSYYFKEEFFRNGKGIHGDLWTTKWDYLKNINIPIPSMKEQKLISNYLDIKTHKIEILIKKIQKKIELLKEQRISLINQCITKGLDPNVKMKDSGVKSIGKIPIHWDRICIKHLVSTKIADGPHVTPTFVDQGIPFLSVEGIVGNKIDFKKIRGFITKESHEIYSKKCKPQKFDILLVKSGSTTGKSSIVETDLDFNIWSPLCILRSNTKKIYPYFFFNSVQSGYFRTQVEIGWSYGTQPNIGMGVVENLWIVTPPLDEQVEINSHLKKLLVSFERKIENYLKQIELYKEYRFSLIFSIVSGKIKITENML